MNIQKNGCSGRVSMICLFVLCTQTLSLSTKGVLRLTLKISITAWAVEIPCKIINQPAIAVCPIDSKVEDEYIDLYLYPYLSNDRQFACNFYIFIYNHPAVIQNISDVQLLIKLSSSSPPIFRYQSAPQTRITIQPDLEHGLKDKKNENSKETPSPVWLLT